MAQLLLLIQLLQQAQIEQYASCRCSDRTNGTDIAVIAVMAYQNQQIGSVSKSMQNMVLISAIKNEIINDKVSFGP